jgi:hypothetical protein
MSQRHVELLIGRLLTDDDLRDEFTRAPFETLAEYCQQGWDLSRGEIDAFADGCEVLENCRRTVAVAVAAIESAAVALKRGQAQGELRLVSPHSPDEPRRCLKPPIVDVRGKAFDDLVLRLVVFLHSLRQQQSKRGFDGELNDQHVLRIAYIGMELGPGHLSRLRIEPDAPMAEHGFVVLSADDGGAFAFLE